MSAGTAPRGFRFNPFADVARGRSLFEMQPEDWLEPDPAACTCQGGYHQPVGVRLRANDCPLHGVEDGDDGEAGL